MIGVAIPARNERAGIGVAVRSVLRATRQLAPLSIPGTVVVADDSSSDGTGEIAALALGGSGEVIQGRFGSAGGARRAAIERILELTDGLPPSRVWIATTDADSRVPACWLSDHATWWREGADAVAGLVRPMWRGTGSTALRERYEEMMRALGTGPGHPHVHGANLGFTAAAYVRSGGIPLGATSEDHALWNAIRSSGGCALSVADEPVATSARLVGRAPEGFASLLAGLSLK